MNATARYLLLGTHIFFTLMHSPTSGNIIAPRYLAAHGPTTLLCPLHPLQPRHEMHRLKNLRTKDASITLIDKRVHSLLILTR